jgi:transcriptional regulator with XRE-family HTH domain
VKTPLLREWREAKGETQASLAALSGITEATISRIEHDAPLRPSTAKKLAGALGVTVVDLMNSPPVPAGKAEAPTTGQASAPLSLLEKALNAARQDAQKTARAINRLAASQGVLPATHITQFEEDTFRAELRALGFPDEHFEDFIWPLVTRVIEQEGEISRLRGDVADAAQETLEEATSSAQEIAEGVARAAQEATERTTNG